MKKLQYKTFFHGWVDVTPERAEEIKKSIIKNSNQRMNILIPWLETRFREVKENDR